MNDLEINDNTLLFADDAILVNNSGRDMVTLEMESDASFKVAVD